LDFWLKTPSLWKRELFSYFETVSLHNC